MDKFTLREKQIECLYDQKMLEEVIEKCKEFIETTDQEDRAALLYYNRMLTQSNYHLEKLDDALGYCNECIKYATTDTDTHLAFWNKGRIYYRMGNIAKAVHFIDKCITFFTNIDRLKEVANLLAFKGDVLKNEIFCLEALKYYRLAASDTTDYVYSVLAEIYATNTYVLKYQWALSKIKNIQIKEKINSKYTFLNL